MGSGSYNASDWSKLKSSRNISSSTHESEIFRRQNIDPRFDPKFINVREARDSEEHPNSTPIIIGLDVTGSMGYLSQKIATEALNETMMKLYSTKIVEDPALLFAAYGDFLDAAPLQVTQFESDIRIAEQLLELWLENQGSGMVVPNLLWHFAANHTSLDSIEKHNKKGFLFTIGDFADARENETIRDTFIRVFGEDVNTSTEHLVAKAKEKFEIFHIFIGGSAKLISSLLKGHTMIIEQSDIDALPEIIISAMQISNGMDKQTVLNQWSDLAKPVVEKAISPLVVGNAKKGISF